VIKARNNLPFNGGRNKAKKKRHKKLDGIIIIEFLESK